MRSRGAAAPLLAAALLAGHPLGKADLATPPPAHLLAAAQPPNASQTSPGAIAGRLIGTAGLSAAGVTIDALSLRAAPGLPPPVAATVVTGPDGAFRLSGLPAGQYLVATRGTQISGARYSPTYHPGVGSPDDATIVSVAAGQEAGTLAFRYAPLPTATLEGTLVAPDRRPLLSGAVLLAPQTASGLDGPVRVDVQLAPDGRFRIEHVPAGRYELRARADLSTDEPTFFGAFTVTVSGSDVPGVTVPLLPGAIVQGTVKALSRPLPRVAHALMVRAPFADGSSFGDSLTGGAKGGAFEIRGLMRGTHVVEVEGLPEDWAVTSLRLRGREIADGLLTVSHGERIAGLEIGLSDDAPDVEGVVRNAAGRPVEDALVVAVPHVRSAGRIAARQVRMVRTGRDGRYRVADLRPGERRVAAFDDLDELAAMRPATLAHVSAAGTPATLRRGETTTIELTVGASKARVPDVR